MARLWIVLLILTTCSAGWGQETDSLFFLPDTLQLPLADLASPGPPGIRQRRAIAEPFMQTRVHFTGDFFRRFNNPPGNSQQRQNQVRALFDAEDPRLDRRQPGGKSTYADLVDQFIDESVGGLSVRLLVSPEEHLYAEVTGRATWQQQDRTILLYLKKSRTGVAWSWKIIGVSAGFLPPVADSRSPIHQDSLVFIPPNAHELNFMGLAKQLRAGCDPASFVQPTAVHEPAIRAFGHYLSTEQLRVVALQTTTLWLDTQWGWWLQLRHINRETDNSGWLISNLCRSGNAAGLPPVLWPFMTDSHPGGNR